MNNNRVGCLVPRCELNKCSRSFKKQCALRRYFLLEQVKIRREISLQMKGYNSGSVQILLDMKNAWRCDGQQEKREKFANQSYDQIVKKK